MQNKYTAEVSILGFGNIPTSQVVASQRASLSGAYVDQPQGNLSPKQCQVPPSELLSGLLVQGEPMLPCLFS